MAHPVRTSLYNAALKAMFTIQPERIHDIISSGLGILQVVTPLNRIMEKIMPFMTRVSNRMFLESPSLAPSAWLLALIRMRRPPMRGQQSALAMRSSAPSLLPRNPVTPHRACFG